jgi:tRNA-modifying protein YgfZ
VSGVLGVIDGQVAALRHGAGAYLLPRDAVAVRGADAEAYLQGQLSQDIAPLAVGDSTDSLLLGPDGKLVALLRLTRVDAQGYVLDVDAGYGDTVIARLKKFLLRSKVEIEPLDWRCLALRGAGVETAAAPLLTVMGEAGVMALPFEWNGWSGIDLLGPRDMVMVPDTGNGITACDADAVEACRIVSGIPAMGSELTEKTIAAEAGLVERTVSFTKGCYTGQELIARLDARGSNVPRRLVGVVAGTEPLAFGMTLHRPDPPAPTDPTDPTGAPDDPVADKVVGSVTSAAWSPEMGAWVGLAYLHRTVDAPGDIRIRSGDGLGGARPARAVTLPMITSPPVSG